MSVTEAATMSFGQAVNRALDEALAVDPDVFLIGEDIADDECGGVLHVTAGLSTKYGTERVRSTPISEEVIVGAGVGAALAGMRPVVEIMFMNFLTLAMDQIYNHAAKLRFMSGGRTTVPMTIRMSSGAGGQFGAHHSDQLEAWLAHSPGLKVVFPSSPADAYGLLTSCIFDDDPCVFVEHTLLYFAGMTGPAPEPGTRIPLGQANVVREGRDVTLIAYGRSMLDAEGVAGGLASQGIGVEVVDLRTIAPLDYQTVLESVAKTKRAVIVHEARKDFGVGAEIAARIHSELFGELAAPVARVGAPSCPVPYAPFLEMAYIPGAAPIEQAIRSVLG